MININESNIDEELSNYLKSINLVPEKKQGFIFSEKFIELMIDANFNKYINVKIKALKELILIRDNEIK
jgi:hypothetical protein